MNHENPIARRRVSLLLAALLLALPAGTASAVILDGMNQCTVKLSDGTDVVLYGEFVSKLSKEKVSCIKKKGVSELPENAEPVIAPLDSYRHLGRGAELPDFIENGEPVVTTRANLSARRQSGTPEGPGKLKAEQEKRMKYLQNKYGKGPKGDFRKHKKSPCYYYLPPGSSLRLSKRPDGTPEFLFVKYTTDKSEAEGGVQGGLMHFLMEWSLTPRQEAELRSKVASQCTVDGKKGELMGAVEVEEADEKGSFRIISATLSDDAFTRSVVQSGHAPVMPGGKVAAAANLTANGAQLFLATVEKGSSIADLSVELDFTYVVQLPAAKGEIIFHWDKMREARESFEAEYYSKNKKHGKGEHNKDDLQVSEEEVKAFMDFAVENSVVEFVFEGYNPDSEYTGKIMEAMLQYFLNSLMEPADDAALAMMPMGDEEAPQDDRPDQLGRQGEVLYQIKRDSLEQQYASKNQVVRLDAGLAVRRRFQVVGNMASWYKGVRHNRKCVTEVNLDDPFFRIQELRFIVDLDAKDIFEDVVNYVTVMVKKRRSKGEDFTDSVTIDQKYLAENGVLARITYAGGQDRNPEAFMYATQWSLKGGNLFPSQPRWQRGRVQAVTLAPPVERWEVEVEGDLDQMEANDIARVTVEMHYPLFGEEKFSVIPLSPRAGEWMMSDHIYVDRGTRGFAYRLIIHHKTEGRMVLPWQTRIGDRYVYATIPEEVLVAGNAQDQAKLAAKELGKIGAEKVLDKFSELFASAD